MKLENKLNKGWKKFLKEALEVREALPGEMEATETGADPGATGTERSPVEVDREEYVANKEEGEFSSANALRTALEGTEFADKQVANPDERGDVDSFTESSDGTKVLPLKQVGDTIYFKLNDTYGGSYYKIEGVAPDEAPPPSGPEADTGRTASDEEALAAFAAGK